MTYPPFGPLFPIVIIVTAWLAWSPCLYYGIAAIISVVAIATLLKAEATHWSALDKFIALGPMFFALPMAVFGLFHILEAKFVAQIVPSWIPGHLFWAYFIGFCLIAGAVSLAINKYAGMASALFAILLLSFVLLIHIPNLMGHWQDRLLLGTAMRDLAFSGGALAFAATHVDASRPRRMHQLMAVARFFIAIPILFFAVEQLLHPEFAAGVPLDKVTPTWIPGHLLWSYVTGVVYIPAGLCLILNKWTRWVASALGVVIVILCLFVYLPIVIAIPLDIANGFNYFVDTLLLSGSTLALARTQRDESEAPA